MVNIISGFLFGEETDTDTCILQLVLYLAYLDKEISPFLVVKGEQTASFGFLCYSQISNAVRIVATFEISEIG